MTLTPRIGVFYALYVTVCVSCVALSDAYSYGNVDADVDAKYDCAMAEGTSRILTQAGRQAGAIITQILTESTIDEETRMAVTVETLDQLRDVPANVSEGCRGCLVVIGGLQAFIDQNLTYEDVEPLAVNICYPVALAEGWRPNIVCESVISNFGPHLYYVLGATTLDAQGVCWKWNRCDSEEVDPPVGELRTFSQPKVSAWKAPKRQYDRAIPLDDAIKVVHLTDIHVDKDYFTGAATDCHLPVCCHEEWNGTGIAGEWGDYKCNVPPRTVELYLQFMNAMAPDYIMYTGDTPPHLTWMETQQGQLNATIYVADAIGRNMPGVPAFPTMGNHETYPTNLYYLPRPDIQQLNRVYFDVFQPIAGFGPEQESTILDGGYFSQRLQPGLVVLSYNSNYGSTENWYNLLSEDGPDYARMRQHMEDTLSTARDSGDKVILLGHHPSGSGGRFKSYNAFINDILGRYGDVIILHLQGHGHTDAWEITSNAETGEAYNVQISSPSVTSTSNINPSGRIFYLHPDTFEPLDMDTFYLDLQNATDSGVDPQIQLTYRATEEYGMPDLLPESFMDLINRMENDPDLFAKYRANYETRTGFEGPCDDACRHRELCHMRHTDVVAEGQC